MAGLYDTDIKLDDTWQLTQAATGDAPTASGFECLMQDIRLEAMTQAGEVFYDLEWGWSLLEFIQSEDDELTILEIGERIKEKLSNRDIIDMDTINTDVSFDNDIITILVTFSFINDSDTFSLAVSLDRINVEVVTND
jgi:hypothetical protein